MTIDRRRFLLGAGAAAAALSLPRFRLGAQEAGRAPKRLLILHRACGIVPDSYENPGGERDFELSPILAPYADLRDEMVLLEGLDIRPEGHTREFHGNQMVKFMTGHDTTSVDGHVLASSPSIDFRLRSQDAIAGSRIKSLQFLADPRSNDNAINTRVYTYTGRGEPEYPTRSPELAHRRVFGGLTDAPEEELARQRARGGSVLDFARRRLQRLRDRVGAGEQARLEGFAEGIREIERTLDTPLAGSEDIVRLGELAAGFDPMMFDPETVRTAADAGPPRTGSGNDERVGEGYALEDLWSAAHADLSHVYLDILRHAFALDLTRIGVFGFTPGTSQIIFRGILPEVDPPDGHHNFTHGPNQPGARPALRAICRWYSDQIAAFLRRMRDTPDVDGSSLLDNTLVVVWSEIRGINHSNEDVPVQLFGGRAWGLEGGRKLDLDGHTTSDLWATISTRMGLEMEHFGTTEVGRGRIDGLFG